MAKTPKPAPRICAVITHMDLDAIKGVESMVDMYEVRIDLIGSRWPSLVRHLKKPWIACNRSAGEGGCWQGSEEKRVKELLSAIDAGADTIDIELATEDLAEVVADIKKKAKCLISHHDLERTPSHSRMVAIVQRQLAAGADICKLVTTAKKFEDNMATLQLLNDFAGTRLVSFAMGDLGLTSRILCPLVGGEFVYASIEGGKASASGQLPVSVLRAVYGMLGNEKQ